MIKFYLYSDEYTHGLKMAEVRDESSANALGSYYRTIYDTKAFLITMKKSRQKEVILCGTYNHE